MITYIATPEDEAVTRRRLDDAWEAFREAAARAWEAHCAEKDHKSSVAFDELSEPMRTINALQDELIRYHERCDALANAEPDDDHECDPECAREDLAEMQYQDWKDNAA